MIITDLWKYYGDELVFQNVTATIGPSDRIGFVGANGVGKTTLLKILVGELSPDQGKISRRGGFTQGSLWQTIPSTSKSLRSFLLEPFAKQINLEKELRTIEGEMAVLSPGSSLDQAMTRYARVQASFEHEGGYDYLVQISGVATGLGFSDEDLTRSLDTFSGGEQMRVSLARLLLARPSLLVLDEPTNHLDVEAIQWLESFLSTYSAAFIVVSHDRYFLDKVANRIWELQQHKLYQYRGNYSQYIPQRQLRQTQLEESIEKQEQQKERMEFFIQKFKAGTRSRQAKSMEKKLARLPDLDAVAIDPTLGFNFETRRQSGNNVLFMENISKGYGDQIILNDITLQVKRGERIALLGPNGSGKSTLLKILAGELDFTGKVKWGTGVDVGYFSQQISFNPANTVLEELYDEHRMELGVLRSVLGRFLFRGEDVFKHTSILSGGEKNRLALAKLLLHRPNVLLLDEPTNHLDIYAREALEDALRDFSGTIIYVSHDRYFVEKLATKVWNLADGSVQEFIGNFSAYERSLRELNALKAEAVQVEKARQEKSPRQKRTFRANFQRKIELVEDEIILLEERRDELEQILALPELYQDETKSVQVIQEYQEIEDKLLRKYEAWENFVQEQEEG